MKKLTKIVATIGPASDSEEMIEKLILAGVNIFRFNFKHNTVEWHDERIIRVKKIAQKLGIAVGTLLDLQGPTIRIILPFNDISVKKGDVLCFGDNALKSEDKGFSITNPNIIKYLQDGQRLLADDGTFTFHFIKKGNRICLRSETTGLLKNRKSLNIPGATFPLPVLTDRDYEGLKLVAKNNVDIVALSFVRSAEDIKFVSEQFKKYHVKAKICSKIETKSGIDNIDEIVDASDSVMVARGDLGVETPVEEVPYYQKMMIEKCLIKGKQVITATQMLQTMISNPYPTRAEVSDVANAVFDHTDAVMLSAESAAGAFPLVTVETMSKIVQSSEKKFVSDTRKIINYEVKDQTAILCDTAYNLYTQYLAKSHRVKGFMVFTHTGRTVNLLSRYHPQLPIFAFAPTEKVCDSLTLNFGVWPFLRREIAKKVEVRKSDIVGAIEFLKKNGLVKRLDQLIVLHGDYWALENKTSTIKLMSVQ